MKRILFLLTGLILLVACQENVEPKDPEFDNWKARNEAAFKTQLNVARQNIATAKAQYGNAWEANCDYRLMRKFSLTGESQVKYRDTLCVQILERGTGSGSPYFTDTVRINYTVRLMPTAQHPDGKLMAHSGQSVDVESIFSPTMSAPAKFGVSYWRAAVATALMQMRIGDRWRLYIGLLSEQFWQTSCRLDADYGDPTQGLLPHRYEAGRLAIGLRGYGRYDIKICP
mgnify:CR=1 FL=1